jgi:hypothetical protein
VPGVDRGHQVADVNRVEGAPENTKAFHNRTIRSREDR